MNQDVLARKKEIQQKLGNEAPQLVTVFYQKCHRNFGALDGTDHQRLDWIEVLSVYSQVELEVAFGMLIDEKIKFLQLGDAKEACERARKKLRSAQSAESTPEFQPAEKYADADKVLSQAKAKEVLAKAMSRRQSLPDLEVAPVSSRYVAYEFYGHSGWIYGAKGHHGVEEFRAIVRAQFGAIQLGGVRHVYQRYGDIKTITQDARGNDQAHIHQGYKRCNERDHGAEPWTYAQANL